MLIQGVVDKQEPGLEHSWGEGWPDLLMVWRRVCVEVGVKGGGLKQTRQRV